MSMMQCSKCGGNFGIVGRQVFQCDCPAVPAVMVQELEEAVRNNGTVNDSTNWAGVVLDLYKKGWRKS